MKDIFSLTNLIKESTSFKSQNSNLPDLILTKKLIQEDLEVL